ncbi:MAG: type II secretion system inner membrane protein GspF [Betaproteobacteria bacterium]|nr:type II secretion system protein GspF [Betaproteobacteria bacterium]NBT69188.1 type II secretion system protein GspF [Betaproteobacteria bacterium]NBY08953.1 type II secretion system protein GspF [Betaproteobacteria bacterium]
MPAYSFEALTPQGETRTGVIDADSPRSARSILRTQSLVPLHVNVVGQKNTSPLNRVIWEKRVFSQTDLVVWTRQLASLVGAGLPLERSLTALSEESSSTQQRDLVAGLRAEVNAGSPLAQALAQHPQEFDELYVSVIASGEQSGRIAQVLDQLADDLEAQHQMRNKLTAAMLYPAIVSAVAFLIVMFLLTYVVPQVASVFTSGNRSLPLLTIVMLAISRFVQNTWMYGLLIAIIGAWVLRMALQQESFRERFDAAWLQLPLLGKLSLGYNAARFASTLALLVGAGVPMLRALQSAAQTLSNRALRADAMLAIDLVREGAPLASALSQNKRLPSLLSMFARLGEQTGRLPEMLRHAANHLSNEVQRRAMQLATWLEPLLIVAMGAVVLLIVLAVMMPIIDLNQMVR